MKKWTQKRGQGAAGPTVRMAQVISLTKEAYLAVVVGVAPK